MSRSKRKTAKRGITTARSEKKDKQVWHRNARRVLARILKDLLEFEVDANVFSKEDKKLWSDPWVMDKDGKQSFDPERHPKLMRK